MATTVSAAPSVRSWAHVPGGRMVEWGILAVLVLVFVGVFGHYVRVIQGQGERAAVMSTLGALRTALVIDHVQRAATSPVGGLAAQTLNPFLVLQNPPINYSGEMSVAQSLAAPAGRWVYDPQCVCVGYFPLDAGWHDTASAASVLWFRVGAGPGPRELTALAPYVWRGMLVR